MRVILLLLLCLSLSFSLGSSANLLLALLFRNQGSFPGQVLLPTALTRGQPPPSFRAGVGREAHKTQCFAQSSRLRLWVLVQSL